MRQWVGMGETMGWYGRDNETMGWYGRDNETMGWYAH